MTHRMLPSTKNLIERLKGLDSSDRIFRDTVAYGKGSGVKPDACFARLHSFLLENSLKTMHYLIRCPVSSINYPSLIQDLENYFGKVYNLALFDADLKSTLIVQSNSKESHPTDTDEILYWIMLSILRASDKEYSSALENLKLEPLTINTVKDLIIQWCIASSGSTCHTVNESIVYTYQRHKQSEEFYNFVDMWLKKLRLFCGKDSQYTLSQINKVLGIIKEKKSTYNNQYSSFTYGLSQSPAYRIVEESLLYLEENYD